MQNVTLFGTNKEKHMNVEYEIQKLKETVSNLQETVIKTARNNTPIVGKVDSTANGLSTTDGNVEKNTADITYIAIMSDIDL